MVVGVEGKADESFDRALDAWLARRRRGSPATQARSASIASRARSSVPRLHKDPLLGTLRYQLLSALAGTLADAREGGATTAVLLVHEFDTDKTIERLHARNAADLDAFVGRLMPGAPKLRRRCMLGLLDP